MRRFSVLLGALTATLSSPALADPDLVIEAAPGTPIEPEDVQEALREQAPELAVESVETAGTPTAAARVVIQQFPDGRLSVSYRDPEGRQTVRVLEPGDAPAANVAMVVFNLQQNQLDSVLGSDAAPDPAPEAPPLVAAPRRQARARVRRLVEPQERAPAVSQVGLGFGLVNRSLDVAVEGSSQPRSYAAPAFPAAVIQGEVFPARAIGADGIWSVFGLSGRFVRDLYLQSSGMSAGTLQPVHIDTTFEEIRLQVVADGSIGSSALAPRVRVGAGWSYLLFQLDPLAMAEVEPSEQIPTFAYQGLQVTADGEMPLFRGAVWLGAGVEWFEVFDVGQAVRDLFGSTTEGARGFGARAAIRGELVRRLEGLAALQYRRIDTEMSGISSFAGGTFGGFPSASDEYLDFMLSLAYRVD